MTTRFRVFGGVGAAGDDGPIELGHARQRSVLAVLLAEAGRVVPAEAMVSRVWGDRAPQRARGALYNYVSRLRQALAQAGVQLRREAPGYRLDVDRSAVDVHCFTALIAEAREAGSEAVALALFDEALRLWQGEPFGTLTSPWLDAVREDLHRQRFAAELDRNDVALRRGGHGRILADLAAATAGHPFDERLAGQRMLALYRSGRPADALHHFRELRERLADELGTDPGGPLRELHRRILTADPELDSPVPEAWTVPRQLPAVPRLFTGRTAELERLEAALAEPGTEPPALVISAVSGTAGVGKTTLAVHWAHRVAGRFPDGQLYVNLRGFDRQAAPVTSAEAVIGFLHALNVPAQRIPSGLDAQLSLYRSVLAGRRVLVVLDNARDAEHVRPLLPGAPGCVALITSRDQLVALVATEGARVVGLDLLSTAESRDLLAARIGARRMAAEPRAVGEIIESCARLPLALSVVAARAATYPGFPLEVLAVELRATRDRLDAFSGDGSTADVRSVLSWSYKTVTPAAAALLRLLGLHPGPDVSAAATTALAGRPARAELAELTRAHLVTEHQPGRYALHDLLRLYAYERSLAEDSAALRHEAEHRMLDYYLHSSYEAAMRQVPNRDPIELGPPAAGVRPERPADLPAATAWFAAERLVILRVIEQAVRNGFGTHAWQLGWTLMNELFRTANWAELVEIGRLLLSEEPSAVHAVEGLARASLELGQEQEAERYLGRLLAMHQAAGDGRGQATAHSGFQMLRTRQGRLADALTHAEQALGFYLATGSEFLAGAALNNVGFTHTMLGDPRRAIEYGRRALALLESRDDPSVLASVWDTLGLAHHQLGQEQAAIAAYVESLALLRLTGNSYREAAVLVKLGDVRAAVGDKTGAGQAWSAALTLMAGMKHGDTGEVRKRLEGLIGNQVLFAPGKERISPGTGDRGDRP